MKLPCCGAVFLWIGDSAGKADSKRKTPIDQHEKIKKNTRKGIIGEIPWCLFYYISVLGMAAGLAAVFFEYKKASANRR